MKKPYIDPTIELISADTKEDILLASDSEINAGDLFDPEIDIDIDVSKLFN